MKRTPNMLLVCKIGVTESEKEEAHALEMIQDICCFQAWMPKQVGKVILIKTCVEISIISCCTVQAAPRTFVYMLLNYAEVRQHTTACL